MKRNRVLAMPPVAVMLFSIISVSTAADAPRAIETVEIRDRAIHVNGQPFFPLMIWLQDTKNFPAVIGR